MKMNYYLGSKVRICIMYINVYLTPLKRPPYIKTTRLPFHNVKRVLVSFVLLIYKLLYKVFEISYEKRTSLIFNVIHG